MPCLQRMCVVFSNSVRHLRDACVAHIPHRCCQIVNVLHVDRDRRQPFQDHGSSVRLIPFPNPIRVPVSPADVRPRAAWVPVGSSEPRSVEACLKAAPRRYPTSQCVGRSGGNRRSPFFVFLGSG